MRLQQEATFKVTAGQGILGCLSLEKFKEAQNYYRRNDLVAIKKMMDEKVCRFFANGYEFKAPSATCSSRDSGNDIKSFITTDIVAMQFFLPCFAVR